MATAVSTLVERIRDLLDDYGSTPTTLAAAISTTTEADITVTDSSEFDTGTWLTVDYEVMEVVPEQTTSTAGAVTVRRGARGSAAATHSAGAVVRVDLIYPSHRILRALNAALAAAYPKLYLSVADETLSTTDTSGLYTLPESIDFLYTIEVQSSTGDAAYKMTTAWDQPSPTEIRLYGSWTTGLTMRLRGTAPFPQLSTSTSAKLDPDFPSNFNAEDYLVWEATGRLLQERDMSVTRADEANELAVAGGASTAMDSYKRGAVYRQQANLSLKAAKMPPPPRFQPLPTRRYLGTP